MPALPIHMHPAQKKSALSPLPRTERGQERFTGAAKLPPPRIPRMLLDTMRTPPCGRWAGDHGIDKHGRQPSLVYVSILLRQQEIDNFPRSFHPVVPPASEGMHTFLGDKGVPWPQRSSPSRGLEAVGRVTASSQT